MLDRSLHTRFVLNRGSKLSREDATASAPDQADAVTLKTKAVMRLRAPVMELAPIAVHTVPPHVGELHGNDGSGSNDRDGVDANGDRSGGLAEELWSSVTGVIAGSFTKRSTATASHSPPNEAHAADSMRVLAMLGGGDSGGDEDAEGRKRGNARRLCGSVHEAAS
jgi:hypothetical protein